MPLGGTIREGRAYACDCIGPATDTVEFGIGSLAVERELLAILGSADRVIATTRNGSLRVRRRNGIEWEIPDDAPETASLAQVRGLMADSVEVFGRPLITDESAEYQDQGGKRDYTRAPVKALLIKPILSDDRKRGWEPVTELEGDRMEKRFIEFRNADEGGCSGPIIKYGDVGRIGGNFTERFDPAALKMDEVVFANLMHDRTKPVARTGAGLTIDRRDDGIYADIKFPDTAPAREARELVKAGILRGFSMEFRAIRDEWQENLRVVKEAILYGVAIVDRPAYSESQLAMRFEQMRPQIGPMIGETRLRKRGYY